MLCAGSYRIQTEVSSVDVSINHQGMYHTIHFLYILLCDAVIISHSHYNKIITFTFSHLVDAFIQSDLQIKYNKLL